MLKKIMLSTALTFAGTLVNYSVQAATTPAITAATPSGPIVGKVNGQPIYKSELDKIEKTLPPELVKNAKEKDANKYFAGLVDQAINLKVLTEAAKTYKAKQEEEDKIQAALAQAQEQIRIQAFISSNLESRVNDAAIKEKYDQLVKSFPANEMKVKVSHIMVKTEADAKAIIKDLKAGADFKKVAREKSQDKSTAAEGGDLGYILKGDVDPAFATAAFDLKPGSYSENPVKTALGYHVVKVEDKVKAKPPKFDDQVKEQLGALVFQEQMKKLIDELREKASIERFNSDGKPISASEAATAVDLKADKAPVDAVPSAAPAV